MKIYIIKEFYATGFTEGHYDRGIFSTYEKAKKKFDELGLKTIPDWNNLWQSYIEEKEID